MNYLLSLNKKVLLILLITIFSMIIVFIFLIYFNSNTAVKKNNISINKNVADISMPKFAINSDKQKISVTANEGNFLTKDKIMLENNVVFKSKKFKIYSNNVIFNKKNLVASSNDQSKFVSKNATINSDGFDIIQNGNIINFKGKTRVTLK